MPTAEISAEATLRTQNQNSDIAPYGTWLGGWLVALLLARWVINAFTQTDLFFDEAQYWAWAQELDWGYFSKPPMIGWVIHGASLFCGDSVFCVRAPSALFHTGTAIFIFLAGRRLYDARVGFWASLGFVTLPGISVSAHLISTDVPLLFFWSMALYAFVSFRIFKGWRDALLFGAAIGLGLLSKYAMIYGLILFVLFVLFSSADRWMLHSIKFWAALGISALLIAPNIAWVFNNGAVTFSHTADNANWRGFQINFDEGLEFFSAQLGVFGPILFVALLVITFGILSNRSMKTDKGQTPQDRFLLTLSLPIILAITVQALLSRAHANWAATAYPAATILVTTFLLRHRLKPVLLASLGIHFIFIALIGYGTLTANNLNPPGKMDPFSRLLGWQQLADEVSTQIKATGATTLVTDRRDLSAQMRYYLRDAGVTLLALKTSEAPRDHFEMTAPFTSESEISGPILFLTEDSQASRLVSTGFEVMPLLQTTIQKGPKKQKDYALFTILEKSDER